MLCDVYDPNSNKELELIDFNALASIICRIFHRIVYLKPRKSHEDYFSGISCDLLHSHEKEDELDAACHACHGKMFRRTRDASFLSPDYHEDHWRERVKFSPVEEQVLQDPLLSWRVVSSALRQHIP